MSQQGMMGRLMLHALHEVCVEFLSLLDMSLRVWVVSVSSLLTSAPSLMMQRMNVWLERRRVSLRSLSKVHCH